MSGHGPAPFEEVRGSITSGLKDPLIVYSSIEQGDSGKSVLFLFDHSTGSHSRVPIPSNIYNNLQPIISADGRYIVFMSDPRPFNTSDRTLVQKIYIFDRTTNWVTEIASGTPDFPGGGYVHYLDLNMDSNARYVIWTEGRLHFSEEFTNINGYSHDTVFFVYDRMRQQREQIFSAIGSDDGINPSISSDGKFIVFRSPLNAQIYRTLNPLWRE